jgi:hypothetical protein
MDILLFYALILLIMEIGLDMTCSLGKMHSAPGFAKSRASADGLVSRRAENPDLEVIRQKGRA